MGDNIFTFFNTKSDDLGRRAGFKPDQMIF